jgi:hypothetical protein
MGGARHTAFAAFTCSCGMPEPEGWGTNLLHASESHYSIAALFNISLGQIWVPTLGYLFAGRPSSNPFWPGPH